MEYPKNTNTYILHLQARNLIEPFEVTAEKRGLYNGSLPLSLDVLRLEKKSKHEFYTVGKTGKIKPYRGTFLTREEKAKDSEETLKYYTDAIIDVTFDRGSYHKLKEPKDVFKVVDRTLANNRAIPTSKDQLINSKVVVHKKTYKGKLYKDCFVLRNELYDNGVTLIINGNSLRYVKFKRSSSKARGGSHLFIREDLFDVMNEWPKFGIKYEQGESAPLATIKSSEGLTSSGIEKTIKIRRNEILMIDDVVTLCRIKASVTRTDDDGNLYAIDEDDHEVENIIWDGQSLLDESLFEPDERGKMNGMMQLRSSFFKSCGLNTKIQKWFDEAMKGKNQDYVFDMFGRKVKWREIKLITTPQSLKFLKLYEKFGTGKDSKRKKERLCYETWIKGISEDFGVVKSESSSHFGDYHKLTYQIINTLPLSKADIGTITKIGKWEYKYEGLLKHDLEAIDSIRSDMEYFINAIDTKNPHPSDALVINLLKINPKIWRTKLVAELVRDKVDDYKKNLRSGRIRVAESDYAVLFGNPYEMLQFAISQDKAIEREKLIRPLTGNQIYCKKYKTGTNIAGFRNPHITMGNVLVAENTLAEEFDKYFNLTDNIVISNAYDTDIMYRLQGQDYDGDTILLCPDTLVVDAARKCQEFRVPVNRIKGDTRERRYETYDEADIDDKIANNLIGVIVNQSQLLNSYYWDYLSKNDNGQYDDLLGRYYSEISILSSLQQIEIDKAKKDYAISANGHITKLKTREFNGTPLLKKEAKTFTEKELDEEGAEEYLRLYDMLKELNPKEHHKSEIKEINLAIKALIRTDDKNVLVRPVFLKYCAKGERYSFKPFTTPMDYLQQLIKEIPQKKPEKRIDIEEIVPEPDFRKADSRHLKSIEEAIGDLKKTLSKIQYLENLKVSQDIIRIDRDAAFESAVSKLKKIEPDVNTIRVAIYRAYGRKKGEGRYKKDYGKTGRTLMSLLYRAYEKSFNECFKC